MSTLNRVQCHKVLFLAQEREMAGKESPASLSESEKDDEESSPLEPWQKAWLSRHCDNLVRRMPTLDVVDHLIERGAMDVGMDVYQRIEACHSELHNERARLLLDYIAFQTRKVFWDFQASLTVVRCADLAVRREDTVAAMERFSAAELADGYRRTSPARTARKWHNSIQPMS